jgi:acetyl esterase/lipase
MKGMTVLRATLALAALLVDGRAPAAVRDKYRYDREIFPRVRITRDVAYGQDPGALLDLYEPEGDQALLRPVMVWIHGGGFFQGDKADSPMVNLATHFARCGFVSASINYTLLLRSTDDWRSLAALADAADRATADARDALRFLASERERLRIDAAKLVIGGGSAGAFTALQLGCGSPSVHGMQVRGIVEFWGGLMNPSLLGADAPPILAIHGTADTTVPYAFAERLVARARDVGVRVELRTLHGEGHSAWSPMERHLAWIHEFIRTLW